MIRVLVVEDSPTTRRFLSRVLDEDPAIRVVGQASNGAEAVEMARALEPDLITMDVMMPDMDGLEATRRIMAQRPVPILIVTAYADAPELNIAFEAMKAGAVDVLAKPTGTGEAERARWQEEFLTRVKALVSARPHPMQTNADGKENHHEQDANGPDR